MSKVSTRYTRITKILSAAQKDECVRCSSEFSPWYNANLKYFLDSMITGDEWICSIL